MPAAGWARGHRPRAGEFLASHRGPTGHGEKGHAAWDPATRDTRRRRPAGPALWWAEQGTGEPLVLLHGGLTDARFFSR